MFELRLEKDFVLYCNEEPYQKIHYPLFKRRLFLPKTFESRGELNQWFYSLEYAAAKSYLLFLLNRRDYFKNELEQKMKSKHISSLNIQKLLLEFEDFGFIDDQRVISSYIRKYKEKKSIKEIQFLLSCKGIKKESLSELFALPIEEEKNTIRKLALKKKNRDPKSVFASLYRKGFSSDFIKEILKEIF